MLFSTYGNTSVIYFTSSPLSIPVAAPSISAVPPVFPPNLTLSIDPLKFLEDEDAGAGAGTDIRDGPVSKLARPGRPVWPPGGGGGGGGGGVKLPLAPAPLGPSGRGPIGDGIPLCTLGVCGPEPDPK